MARVRLSTTVDGQKLATCRRMLGIPDSQITDRALESLAREVEARADIAAIEAYPYDDDPDLSWETPPGPDIPYDGEVPQEVLDLAATLRLRRRQ